MREEDYAAQKEAQSRATKAIFIGGFTAVAAGIVALSPHRN